MEAFAGGSPAASHFLCFAKESNQRKASDALAPFGGAQKVRRQNGKDRKLAFGSNSRSFFIRFDIGLFGEA